VLRGEDARARLLAALAGVDRLVLLGDALELRHGPVRDALAAARPVLASIGIALGEAGEVVIVPGNHDHALVERWRERSSRRSAPASLGLESVVDWRAGEPLATVARALSPARVRAAYPGVWLRHDVYATHGHYADRHTTVPMIERLGAGAMARIGREPAGGPRSAEDYEAVLAPMYAWIDAIAQHAGPELGSSSDGASSRVWSSMSGPRRSGRRPTLRRRLLIGGFPVAVAALNRAGIGPLKAELSGTELRRAGVRAFGEALRRLGVDGARYVLFGHTHRAGPLPRDTVAEWRTPGGVLLINTGGWVLEPQFIGRDPSSSPYRPGFGVFLGDDGPPELRNLLD
jgi:hypothetical protein